jgi:hypothetical protein
MMTATGKLQALDLSRNGVPITVLNHAGRAAVPDFNRAVQVGRASEQHLIRAGLGNPTDIIAWPHHSAVAITSIATSTPGISAPNRTIERAGLLVGKNSA